MALRPGTGYNPFLTAADPWAVAISKGRIQSEREWLGRWANRTTPWPDAPGQFEPGDDDVADAYFARYGRRVIDPAPAGAELVGNIWDQVLTTLYQRDSEESLRGLFQPGWRRADFDGAVIPREVTDASFANQRGLICRAFALDNREGYTPQNPIRINRPEVPERGPFIVPGRATKTEPKHWAELRLSPWGCALHYVNDATGPAPEPVPEPPKPPGQVPPPVVDDCAVKLVTALRELQGAQEALGVKTAETERLATDLRSALDNLRGCQVERDRLGGEVDSLKAESARLRLLVPVVVPLFVWETLTMLDNLPALAPIGPKTRQRIGRLRSWIDGLKGRTA